MKYLISVGHTASGNIGCGAVDLLNESDCTREIAPLVVNKLKDLGYEAIKLQIDNSDAYDYVKRTNQANNEGGDLFVEIHLNAGGGTGCEVLTTSGSKASNLAVKVSESISNALGISNRGHKTTSGLYVLNHTSMSAMLIECCFVDNQKDYNAYNAEKIANAIVSGLTGQTVSQGTWEETSNGWKYKKADGSYIVRDWFQYKDKWYYFNEHGIMLSAEWLHLTSTGCDYCFYSDGSLITNTDIYGYHFDENGHAIKL